MTDGYEPHGHVLLSGSTGGAVAADMVTSGVGGGVYPGYGGLGGSGRAIPGYYPAPSRTHILVISSLRALPMAK